MEVVEKVILKNLERGHAHASEKVVMSHEQPMPDNCQRIVTDADPDNMMDEVYAFTTTLQLKKSLQHCRVAVDTDPIKIEHRLKLYVDLHNPEGHTSQVSGDLLYCAPNTNNYF